MGLWLPSWFGGDLPEHGWPVCRERFAMTIRISSFFSFLAALFPVSVLRARTCTRARHQRRLSRLTIAIWAFLWTGLVLRVAAIPAPADAEAREPNDQELSAAKELYANFGATYRAIKTPDEADSFHCFCMAIDATDNDLKGAPDLPFRFGLGLSENITDLGLRNLKDLKQLAFLSLSSAKITDVGLKEISSLERLTALFIVNANVTDAGLLEIKKLKNLRSLDLSGTKVTDKGMTQLTEFRKLRVLVLNRTKITDTAASHLNKLTNLIYLSLEETAMTDTGLKTITKLNRLAVLDLSGTRITDACVKDIKEMKSLSVLRLAGTRLTATGLTELRNALPHCKVAW